MPPAKFRDFSDSLLGAGAMVAATTQGAISALVMVMELTGQARLFALPMLIAIVAATATARSIEMRSIYEARLTDEQVAQRLRAREPRGATGSDQARRDETSFINSVKPIACRGFIFIDMACSLCALIRKRGLRSWRDGGRRSNWP